MILCLAVLIQYRSVTDRHTTTAYTALSSASRGNDLYQREMLLSATVSENV